MSLNKEFIQDCKVWLQFLGNADNVKLCRPFLDFSDAEQSTILNFYSDASKNENLGMVLSLTRDSSCSSGLNSLLTNLILA